MIFTPGQMGLVSLCALLLLAIVYDLTAPLSAIAIPDVSRRSEVPALLPAQPFIPAPSSSFASINERPIFSQARKPIAPAPTGPAAAPPPPPTASLVGVILDGDNKLALVKTPASPLEASVKLGESVGGWQLVRILPDRIVLQLGTAIDEIKLESNRAKDDNASKGATGSPAIQGSDAAVSAPTVTQPALGSQAPGLTTSPGNATATKVPPGSGSNTQATTASPSNGTDKHN